MQLNRIIARLFPIGFVVIGIVVIIISIMSLNQQDTFTPTTGVIQDIKEFEELDTNGDITYTYEVTVDYKVDGKAYTSVMGDYTSDYEVGKTIDILYDPDDPTVIVAKGKSSKYITIAIGVVAILIGIITFLKGLRN